jgi:hypothetical protein
MFKTEYSLSHNMTEDWGVGVNEITFGGTGGSGYGQNCGSLLEALEFIVNNERSLVEQGRKAPSDICLSIQTPNSSLRLNDNDDARKEAFQRGLERSGTKSA